MYTSRRYTFLEGQALHGDNIFCQIISFQNKKIFFYNLFQYRWYIDINLLYVQHGIFEKRSAHLQGA